MSAAKAMILAAGEGTRLRPLTLDRPKVMVPVAGKPVMEHTVGWLRHFGVTDIAVNLCHHPAVVTEYFGDGSPFGVNLRYSVEASLLGTAGGVKRLESFFRGTFVVIYGDVLTDLDLGELLKFHFAKPAGPRVTVALYRVPNPTECGIVELAAGGRITQFREKPAHPLSDLANTGVLVVEPQILHEIPADETYDFGHDLFPRLLGAGVPMYGWPLPDDAYLIDMGTSEKYVRACEEWPTARATDFLTRVP